MVCICSCRVGYFVGIEAGFPSAYGLLLNHTAVRLLPGMSTLKRLELDASCTGTLFLMESTDITAAASPLISEHHPFGSAEGWEIRFKDNFFIKDTARAAGYR